MWICRFDRPYCGGQVINNLENWFLNIIIVVLDRRNMMAPTKIYIKNTEQQGRVTLRYNCMSDSGYGEGRHSWCFLQRLGRRCLLQPVIHVQVCKTSNIIGITIMSIRWLSYDMGGTVNVAWYPTYGAVLRHPLETKWGFLAVVFHHLIQTAHMPTCRWLSFSFHGVLSDGWWTWPPWSSITSCKISIMFT